ncbi:hypothetical protein GQ600_16656 [Phytophthora cactorum]|nr:hypothetical protein GQ600_16656 [Phytophthora cactorum]
MHERLQGFQGQVMFCTLCARPTTRLMRYKLLTCRCTQCKRVGSLRDRPQEGTVWWSRCLRVGARHACKITS